MWASRHSPGGTKADFYNLGIHFWSLLGGGAIFLFDPLAKENDIFPKFFAYIFSKIFAQKLGKNVISFGPFFAKMGFGRKGFAYKIKK